VLKTNILGNGCMFKQKYDALEVLFLGGSLRCATKSNVRSKGESVKLAKSIHVIFPGIQTILLGHDAVYY